MQCSYCGTNYPADALICQNCARPLVLGETATLSLPPEGETNAGPIVTESLGRPRLAPIPPRPESLTPTDPRLRIVAPPRRTSRIPLLAIPLGFVCGLLAIVGGFAAAANTEGPWRAIVNPTVETIQVRQVATPTQAAGSGQPTVVSSPAAGSSPAVASATPASAATPITGGSSSPTVPSPTTGPAATPTTAPAASATPVPQPTVPPKTLKNTPQSTYSTGETAWRNGAGLTLQGTQASIGTITNPTARLTATFVFSNETGDPMSFPLSAGNLRVVVKGDTWRATNLSVSSVNTADGASQTVVATFTATGNLLQYQDVTTVNIIVDKFGPVEGVSFNARFR